MGIKGFEIDNSWTRQDDPEKDVLEEVQQKCGCCGRDLEPTHVHYNRLMGAEPDKCYAVDICVGCRETGKFHYDEQSHLPYVPNLGLVVTPYGTSEPDMIERIREHFMNDVAELPEGFGYTLYKQVRNMFELLKSDVLDGNSTLTTEEYAKLVNTLTLVEIKAEEYYVSNSNKFTYHMIPFLSIYVKDYLKQIGYLRYVESKQKPLTK